MTLHYGGTTSLWSKYFIFLLSTSGHFVLKLNNKKGGNQSFWGATFVRGSHEGFSWGAFMRGRFEGTSWGFHPFVCLFTQNIIIKKPVKDLLHAVWIRILDRFSYYDEKSIKPDNGKGLVYSTRPSLNTLKPAPHEEPSLTHTKNQCSPHERPS